MGLHRKRTRTQTDREMNEGMMNEVTKQLDVLFTNAKKRHPKHGPLSRNR
jgi:hypothetical protein